jgi:hypothetical protein
VPFAVPCLPLGVFEAPVDRDEPPLGEMVRRGPAANSHHGAGRRTLSASREHAAPAPWLRQIGRVRAILIYRDLPPAILMAPRFGKTPRLRPNVP